jgi:phosphate transport system substrate-binding protein
MRIHSAGNRKSRSKPRSYALMGLVAASAVAAIAPPAAALKYAEPSHKMKPDRSIPHWRPGPLETEPEEAVNIVGADVMDEMTLGWAKLVRKAYPRLSVTIEARASGSGAPGLISGKGHLAPVGREMLPAEEAAFTEHFGYAPTRFRVATGSVGSLGKTAASIIMVDKDNPISCLSLLQLDAIYSKDRLRGGNAVSTWSDLGVTGNWASRPIHLYGLRHPNGIESYFQERVMNGGAYRDDIDFVKGAGFVHAFNVAAKDMAKRPGGLTYALIANIEANTRVVPLSEEDGGKCVSPTTKTIYDHSYALSRYVYIYVNKAPDKPLEPKVAEFLRAVLSYEGQKAVADDRVYIPLMPSVVQEERTKLESMTK